MLPLAAIDPAEIVDWVMRHAGPIFIAVVFFVLPILRGLKEQGQKKAAAERQRQAAEQRAQASEAEAPLEEPADGEAGRRAFEALLRGEEPVTAVPPPAPATPPPLERGGTERTEPLAGQLSDFAPAPSEDELESSLDEQREAREPGALRLREELRRRSDFLAQEREPAARLSVAPEGLATLEVAEPTPSVPIVPGARRLLGGKGGDRRALLRRAIVAREILGPPLSVRTDTDALGPTALNR